MKKYIIPSLTGLGRGNPAARAGRFFALFLFCFVSFFDLFKERLRFFVFPGKVRAVSSGCKQKQGSKSVTSKQTELRKTEHIRKKDLFHGGYNYVDKS